MTDMMAHDFRTGVELEQADDRTEVEIVLDAHAELTRRENSERAPAQEQQT